MADKSINQLDQVNEMLPSDLFVCQQGGQAKSVSGAQFAQWLVEKAEGHGGIASFETVSTTAQSTTYKFTTAGDGTTFTFTVNNGKSISSITSYFAVSASADDAPTSWKTSRADAVLTSTEKYLWSYMHIEYNYGAATDTTKIVIGTYGDKGAPGQKGDKGAAAELTSNAVAYAVGTSGTVRPAAAMFSTSVPPTNPGDYLWTRTRLVFNGDTANPVESYSVSYIGLNGSGAGTVTAVNEVQPDASGNVTISASDLGALADGEGTVSNTNLAAGSVTNIKIYDGSVSYNKLADDVTGLIGGAKVASRSFDFGSVASGAAHDDLIDVHIEGYTPIGLLQFNPGARSGAITSWNVTKVNGRYKMYISMLNVGKAQATYAGSIHVLYNKDQEE